MATTVDEITVNYEEDNVQLVKELDKKILSKGGPWTTIIFKLQELDKQKNEWGPEKFSIRRYQKRGGNYMQKSKFNISGADQAQKIIDALNAWLAAS